MDKETALDPEAIRKIILAQWADMQERKKKAAPRPRKPRQSARRGGRASQDSRSEQKSIEAVADTSYVRDSGIDRDALAKRNRAILLERGFTEAEADRVLSVGDRDLRDRERSLDRLGRFARRGRLPGSRNRPR